MKRLSIDEKNSIIRKQIGVSKQIGGETLLVAVQNQYRENKINQELTFTIKAPMVHWYVIF